MAPDDSDDNDEPLYDEEQPAGTSTEKSYAAGGTITPCHLYRTSNFFSSGAKRKIKTEEDVAEEESLNAKLTGLSARQRNQCVAARAIGCLCA